MATPDQVVPSILAMPMEIILKILEFDDRHIHGTVIRRDTRRLAETCSQLRRMILPVLWKQFEVTIPFDSNIIRYRRLQERLERRSRLMRDHLPHLHNYVREIYLDISIDVTFGEAEETYPWADSLRAFADCLLLLPNVTKICILEAPIAWVAQSNIFTIYPNIHDIILSQESAYFLAHCPNANNISFIGGSVNQKDFYSKLAVAHLEKVSSLSFVSSPYNFDNGNTVKESFQCYKSLSSLKRVTFACHNYLESVHDLERISATTIENHDIFSAMLSAAYDMLDGNDDPKVVLIFIVSTRERTHARSFEFGAGRQAGLVKDSNYAPLG